MDDGFTACRDDVITMGAHYDFGWPAMIDGQSVPYFPFPGARDLDPVLRAAAGGTRAGHERPGAAVALHKVRGGVVGVQEWKAMPARSRSVVLARVQCAVP